jgi:hypothetical protein
VLIEDFATGGLVQVLGCGFTRTVLRGKFDSLFIREDPGSDSGNAHLYRSVDWALDVSQADFKDCDIRGIPPKLLRLDPETQVVVTRQRAQAVADWERLSCSRWKTAVRHLLNPRLQLEAQVMIAGRRSSKFKELLQGIRELRELGLVESQS